MLDQFAERIGPGHRVIVDLGDAGLVHRGRRIEFARENLAAEPVGGFKDGDTAKFASFRFQYQALISRQAAATIARSSMIVPSSPAPDLSMPGLTHHRKSIFHSEGKMNKMRSRSAASK